MANGTGQQGGRLETGGNRIVDFLTRSAPGLAALGLLAGNQGRVADLLRSPLVQSFQRRNEGRRLSERLEGQRPGFQRVSAQDALIEGAGFPDVSLQSIGQQAFQERRDTFDQLTQLQGEQRNVIANFRESMGDAFSGMDRAEQAIINVGQQNNAQFRAGIQSVNQFRRQTLTFMGAALRNSAQLLRDIESGNKDVLNRIDLEVAERVADMSSGIQARNNATYRQTMSAMDSVSPLAPEERAALRSIFERQTATDIATGMGQLSAAVSEFRANVDTSLQNNLSQARSYALSASTQLFETGIGAFAQAEQLTNNMRQSFVDNGRLLATARSQLQQFGAQLRLQSGGVEYQMVSEMARPVAVFSDVLADLFDMSFDVFAFNNNIEQQELVNEMLIARPDFEAAWAAISGLEEAQRFDETKDLQREQMQTQMITGIASAGLEGVLSGFGKGGGVKPPTPGAGG